MNPPTSTEAARVLAALRTNPGRKKVLAPCPHCGQQFGARELRAHQPQCRKAAAARWGKKEQG